MPSLTFSPQWTDQTILCHVEIVQDNVRWTLEMAYFNAQGNIWLMSLDSDKFIHIYKLIYTQQPEHDLDVRVEIWSFY